MADISKITLPSGSTYDLKDAYAREQIAALSNYTAYLGVTTTALTDGATTNPIVINSQNVTVSHAGSICTYGSKEFVWNGSAWQEFGDLSALGDLAYADTASTSYTPQGSVSGSFTGSESSVSITASASDSGNYTPAGTISGTTFTGSSMTSTGTFTPSGTVSLTNSDTSVLVRPALFGGAATYTPEGDITPGEISVKTEGATSTIHNPTKQTVAKTVTAAAPGATAPANAITYYSVANETLSLYQLGYTTGDSITTSDVTVKTGDAEYVSTGPTFSGYGVRLVTENISVPSSASFSGTEGNVSVSGTTTGSVSNGTFTGNKVQLAGTTTPEGSISATFSGTAATITVSPDE
jgi:hypothetical protein